jgi:hypothetical protein
MSLHVNNDYDNEYPEYVDIGFFYPPNKGLTKEHVYINLLHVRAARGIVIRYDFDRDGWAIEADIFVGDEPHEAIDGEVAFITAWEEDNEDGTA